MNVRNYNELKINWCVCAYSQVDKILFTKTEGKLPRYKCKKCDNFWKNPNHKGY